MSQPGTDYNVRRYSHRWVLALLPVVCATTGCGALGSLGGGGIGAPLNLASALISFVLDLPNPIDVELQAPAQATASLGVISERHQPVFAHRFGRKCGAGPGSEAKDEYLRAVR